jgi:hypothetical protein
VAYYVTTALGREVPLEDWGAVNGDTILKVLHDYRVSPFNPQNLPLPVTALANATGLSPADAEALAESLTAQGLVEAAGQGRFRITGSGVVFVRNAVPQVGHRGGLR